MLVGGCLQHLALRYLGFLGAAVPPGRASCTIETWWWSRESEAAPAAGEGGLETTVEWMRRYSPASAALAWRCESVTASASI